MVNSASLSYLGLLLFSNSLKRGSILFDIHKTTGVIVSLYPLFCNRVKSLRTVFYRTISMSVTTWGIGCHTSLTSFYCHLYMEK